MHKKLRLIALTLFVVIATSIFYKSAFLMNSSPQSADYFSKKALEWIKAIEDELFPISIAFLFGMVGGLIKFISSKIDDRQNSIYSEDYIFLGGLLGIVSYLVLNSKMLIKGFYPATNFPDVEPTFVGTALAATLFGFLAPEITGVGKRVFDQAAERFLYDQMKKEQEASEVNGKSGAKTDKETSES